MLPEPSISLNTINGHSFDSNAEEKDDSENMDKLVEDIKQDSSLIDKLDSKRLRKLCLDILGEKIGPVTPNTKSLYARKLKSKLGQPSTEKNMQPNDSNNFAYKPSSPSGSFVVPPLKLPDKDLFTDDSSSISHMSENESEKSKPNPSTKHYKVLMANKSYRICSSFDEAKFLLKSNSGSKMFIVKPESEIPPPPVQPPNIFTQQAPPPFPVQPISSPSKNWDQIQSAFGITSTNNQTKAGAVPPLTPPFIKPMNRPNLFKSTLNSITSKLNSMSLNTPVQDFPAPPIASVPAPKSQPAIAKDQTNTWIKKLSLFKSALESGTSNMVKSMIFECHKLLINTDVALPSIIHEGFRLNALHIAARYNRIDNCTVILDIVGNKEFIRRTHCLKDEEVVTYTRDRLLGMFLNMPENGNGETPLHIACKYGFSSIVNLFLSFKQIDLQMVNKMGQKPADLICSMLEDPDKDL